MSSPTDDGIARRDALRMMAAATLAPAGALRRPSRGQGVIVFRLRTRDTRACRACEIHHRYLVFISHARANRNRAHPGCNCPITKEKLPKEEFRRIFLDTRAIRLGMADLRKLRIGEGSRRGKRVGGPPPKRHAVGGRRTA